jgi:hypothetical protein
MCPGSDELLLGPLIDFHTRGIRANVLACSRVGRGAGVKQIWRDGSSRARLLDLCVPLSEAHDQFDSIRSEGIRHLSDRHSPFLYLMDSAGSR